MGVSADGRWDAECMPGNCQVCLKHIPGKCFAFLMQRVANGGGVPTEPRRVARSILRWLVIYDAAFTHYQQEYDSWAQ